MSGKQLSVGFLVLYFVLKKKWWKEKKRKKEKKEYEKEYEKKIDKKKQKQKGNKEKKKWIKLQDGTERQASVLLDYFVWLGSLFSSNLLTIIFIFL